VRSEVKEAARSVVSALFTSYELKAQPGAASEFQYDKIALVGHSLGSVIAYDTLNRLMLDDWLCGGAFGGACGVLEEQNGVEGVTVCDRALAERASGYSSARSGK
jgi:hypothetical protein